MKKREPKKKNNKLILFPDLEKRLLEKGLVQLQKKNFQQAINLFEDALEIAPENGDVYIGLVLAYYENGLLEKAKLLSKEMLNRGIGDYFETVDLYLMILVQLHDYEEIITTIKVLLEEREIPGEKLEHFLKMLEFSKRMLQDSPKVNPYNMEGEAELEPPLNLHLFENNDPNQQVLTIAQLSNKNIRPYVDEIKTYLESKEGQPFLKTMLLNILKEQEYEKELTIEKFGWEKIVIPTELFFIQENNQKLEIQTKLQNQLESDNPILFQQIISLLERQLFLLYPFELLPNNSALWAAAYHSIGIEYSGGRVVFPDMSGVYGVDVKELDSAFAFVKKLEEFSYPIL